MTADTLTTLLGPRLAFLRGPQAGLMSIVIPCGREPDGLAITLDSLRACTQPVAFDYEIIVGNDGADPAVSKVAADYGVAEVALPVNRGPAAARNRAIEASAGEVIAMIDCDLVLCPGWIEEAWRAGREFDYAGGLAVTNRQLVFTAAHRYDAINAFDVKMSLEGGHYAEGLNLIVRRALLERIGGFDERLRCGEDHELGDRAYRMGASQGFWPAARVDHPPRSFRQQFSKHRRIVMGHTLMNELWPGRFPKEKAGIIRILRLLAPPKRVGRSDAGLLEFGALHAPVLYLTAWLSKLTMLYHILAIRFGGEGARTWGDFESRANQSTG